MTFEPKITLIGAGRVATHLGLRMAEVGVEVSQVFSRELEKAARLASKIGAEPTDDFEKISPRADLFILAVSDAAIGSVAEKLAARKPTNAVVVHCSGATSREILALFFKTNGVVWPIQSFSFETKIDWRRLPLILEASDDATLFLLKNWARKMSGLVRCESGEARARLHLAATMVNNFTNHLYSLAYQFLENDNSKFDTLRPLILETALKIQHAEPQKMQTGPAIRGDETTIEKHLSLLRDEPKLFEIYKILSDSIASSRL